MQVKIKKRHLTTKSKPKAKQNNMHNLSEKPKINEVKKKKNTTKFNTKIKTKSKTILTLPHSICILHGLKKMLGLF